MKKIVFFTITLFVVTGLLFAGNLIIHKTDGTQDSYPISNIDRITFEGEDLPTEGLVAYYPFNGNANDESGNGHDGTPNNGVDFSTEDRFGNTDKAIFVDGEDDYIGVPNSEELKLTQFSICAWIKYPTNNGINSMANILMKGNGTPSGSAQINYAFYVNGDQKPAVFFEEANDADHYVYGQNAYNDDNAWHFLVATYDNSFLKLYIDNSLHGKK